MAAYFLPGIEVSVAVALIAGAAIGVVLGFASFTSVWLFNTEMFFTLIGGTVVVIAQLVFGVMAGAMLGIKAALLIFLMFVVAEPIIAFVAVATAVVVGYLIRKITCNWPGI